MQWARNVRANDWVMFRIDARILVVRVLEVHYFNTFAALFDKFLVQSILPRVSTKEEAIYHINGGGALGATCGVTALVIEVPA